MRDRSSAALYGKGVFTTIAISYGEPLFWEKHWRRLNDNARRVGIDLSHQTDQTIRDAVTKAIRDDEIISGRARITFSDDRPSAIWSTPEPEPCTNVNIIVAESRRVPSPFRLTASPYQVNSRSPLTGVKSCNYLENVLAIAEVTERGCHEGLRVNERGHVTGGCMSNVFWLKGNRLHTPALSTGCLPGTTREFVLENMDSDEVEAEIVELDAADAIFLTSAGLGIVRVDEFNGRSIGGRDHPLLGLWPPQ